MPIYEYRCSSCGFQKEYLQKLSDPVLTDCPECGKQTFSKMVSAAGFQLKGSGWYATDFKNSGSKPAAKSEASKSEGAKGEGAKSEGAKGESSSSSGSSDSGGSEKKAAPSRGAGGCSAC